MAGLEVSFELATPDDVETLVDVQVRAFHSDARTYPGVEEGGPPGYDSAVETLRKMNEGIFYKIVDNGEIVGDITLFESGPSGLLHLDVLAIVPEKQNLGIGSLAMEFIETAHPAETWTLDTPGHATRNHHFYEKFGFVKVGEQTFDGGFVLFNYMKRTEVKA